MPTSPIGKAFLGFTLLEMLVVLTIIGIITALAVPFYSKMAPRLRILSANHELLLDLRHARSEAMTDKRTITIPFYPDQNTYVLDDHKHKMAVDIIVSLEKMKEQSPEDTSTLHFYSDGSATPGLITLSDNGRRINIHIDGLTGQAESDEN